MKLRPIRTTSTLLIVALAAIVGLLVRRDYLTRRLLVRTISDMIEDYRAG